MNECEFHEKCDKCVGINIKKKKLNKCLYCGNKDDCKVDEFESFCCKKCDKNINKKVEEVREEIANQGRCPKCVYTNNSTNCEDKKCSNYVSELFTGRLPTELRTYLNVKLQDNNEELLRHNVKSIMIIAEAIYKQGVKDGEGYQEMSRAINENKCH